MNAYQVNALAAADAELNNVGLPTYTELLDQLRRIAAMDPSVSNAAVLARNEARDMVDMVDAAEAQQVYAVTITTLTGSYVALARATSELNARRCVEAEAGRTATKVALATEVDLNFARTMGYPIRDAND